MLIERITLNNFKSYAEATVPLRPGTTAIVGENGAGKSTLLDAIGLVLFDHRPEGFTLSGLVREGATSGSAIVRLRCGQGDRCYEVERGFSTTTTTRYRVYEVMDDDGVGSVVAEGNEDVTAWLHRQLDVDEDMPLRELFASTIGVPQGTLTAPFLLPAGGRKQVFEPLLRVHEYRRASDALLLTMRELEGQANDMRRDIARLEGELATRERLLEERDALSESLEHLEAQLSQDEATWEEVSHRVRDADALAERVRRLQAELESARAALQVQAARLESARRDVQQAREAVQQVAAAEPGHAAYLKARQSLDAMEAERGQRDRLRDRLASLHQQRAKVAARLDQLRLELTRLRQAQARLAELQPDVERHEALANRQRELQRAVARLEAASRNEALANQRLAAAREDLERAHQFRQRAEQLDASQRELQARIEVLRQREGEIRVDQARDEAELERLQRQIESLRTVEGDGGPARCPVCESELTPEHRDELLSKAEESTAALAQRSAAATRELGAVAGERGKAGKELQKVASALRRADASADVARAEEHVAQMERQLADARQACVELADAPEELAACSEQLTLLSQAVREHGALQQRLRESARTAAQESDARQELAQIDADVADAERDLAAFVTLDERMATARADVAAHQADHETYLRFEASAAALPQREETLSATEEQARAAEQRVTEAEGAHSELAATYNVEAHTQLRAEERRLSDALGRGRTLHEAQSARLATVRGQLAHLLEVDAERAAREEELAEVQGMTDDLSEVRDLLRQAGPYVTRQLVYRISREAASLYADIMADPTGRLEWSDEDFELKMDVKGHKRTFRQFSGGEQMIAALALRLALLRTSSAIDVAFFDEPTAHLDAARREGLADKIMAAAGGSQLRGFSQMFVISHDDTFEQAAQSYLRVYKDGDGSHVETL